MSKICAKCSKAVYPLEELKCLDKTWHKGCFRCWECNMTLNMKNYKGYDKKPYCSAHYPRTKATVVADTPELQRLARNTELQSQVKYHEEFEKKIKGSKIQISDDPETQRIRQVNSVVSQVEYKGVREKTGNMESRRQSLPPTSEKKERWPSVNSGGQGEFPKSPYSDRTTSNSIVYSSDGKVEAPRQKRIGSIADYDPVNENYGSLAQGYNPVSRLSQSQEWEETVPVSPSMVVAKRNSIKEKSIEIEVNEHELTDHSIKKEEDLNGDSREPESEEVFHNERTNSGNEEVPSPKEALHVNDDHKAFNELKENMEIKTEEVQNTSLAEEIIEDKPQEQESCGSKEIHIDTDDNAETKSTFPPSNVHEHVDEHASVSEPQPIVDNRVEEHVEEAEEGEEEASKSETEEERNQSPEDNKVAEGKPLTGTFAALYDYEAQDEDEVGFLEGDQVVNCESIDAGWMIGTVVRTGERGMLPANYVEQVI